MDIPFKPFTILAVGPFAPVSQGPCQAKVVPVDAPNDALSLLGPALWVPVAKELCPEGGVTIRPERVRDLTPDGLQGSAAYLKDLHNARAFINTSSSGGVPPGEIAAAVRERWPGVPIDLSFQTGAPVRQTRSKVDDILSMVAMGDNATEPAPSAQEGGPASWAAAIDNLIAALMTTIFSDETFRTFEAAWRGVELISKQGPAGPAKDTRLVITAASRETLGDVLDELETTLSADPPDLILIDLPFDSSAAGMELMERAAAFASGLLAVAVIEAAPGFLGLNGWRELGRLPYLKNHIEDNAVYAKWGKLRTGQSGDWLAAACNGFLLRPRYGGSDPPRGVPFEEPSPLWISPVWALGTLSAQAVALSGWPSRFVDSENVRLEGLALNILETGGQASTEVVFSVDRLRQLGEIGLTPLAGAAMKDIAFMPSARSISGGSLPFQMFFSRLTGFLIRLREATGASIPSDDTGFWLKEAIGMFFRRSGGDLPGDLSVSAVTPGPETIFEIALTPPATIVPGSRRITFNFSW
ncbi:MAG TPA: type VI secretion system contractile sheath large subunit [Syntrophorhabdaceae bacterium]|nr:type VI secretion system contractile sheath large subunit [Syntrophorhabdaceae bacterium]